MNFLPRRDILSLEEVDRLCGTFVSLGARKIRITGGEPLVRRNVMSLFHGLSRHLSAGTLDEVTLTTNGSQLARFASELADCGVRRVNVSLDTLDQEKFRQVTRWGDLSIVLAGVDAAAEAGLKVKINTVALKGFNEEEALSLVRWAHGRGFDLTFIEVMPLGAMERDRTDQFLPLTELRARLENSLTLIPSAYVTGGPARYYNVRETEGRLGFITPLTHNFCESCNRVRVTCTGTLYMCLGQEDAVDLREPLRRSASNGPLIEAIRSGIARKPKGHDFVIARSAAPATHRHMNATGG
jgi:cyclic pyranopterin phosphate synthase